MGFSVCLHRAFKHDAWWRVFTYQLWFTKLCCPRSHLREVSVLVLNIIYWKLLKYTVFYMHMFNFLRDVGLLDFNNLFPLSVWTQTTSPRVILLLWACSWILTTMHTVGFEYNWIWQRLRGLYYMKRYCTI